MALAASSSRRGRDFGLSPSTADATRKRSPARWALRITLIAKPAIATVTSASATQAVAGGLGVNGTLMVIGAVGGLTVNSFDLLEKRTSATR
jgi:hypothetical protein